MRNQVFVVLAGEVELNFNADDASPMAPEAARAWLDEQFTALGCEPLRPSGKVLTADKVLRVTEEAGPSLFADRKWSADYARAVHAALGKPLIRVDVPAMAITY
jgi:hypothetical protein